MNYKPRSGTTPPPLEGEYTPGSLAPDPSNPLRGSLTPRSEGTGGGRGGSVSWAPLQTSPLARRSAAGPALSSVRAFGPGEEDKLRRVLARSSQKLAWLLELGGRGTYPGAAGGAPAAAPGQYAAGPGQYTVSGVFPGRYSSGAGMATAFGTSDGGGSGLAAGGSLLHRLPLRQLHDGEMAGGGGSGRVPPQASQPRPGSGGSTARQPSLPQLQLQQAEGFAFGGAAVPHGQLDAATPSVLGRGFVPPLSPMTFGHQSPQSPTRGWLGQDQGGPNSPSSPQGSAAAVAAAASSLPHLLGAFRNPGSAEGVAASGVSTSRGGTAAAGQRYGASSPERGPRRAGASSNGAPTAALLPYVRYDIAPGTEYHGQRDGSPSAAPARTVATAVSPEQLYEALQPLLSVRHMTGPTGYAAAASRMLQQLLPGSGGQQAGGGRDGQASVGTSWGGGGDVGNGAVGVQPGLGPSFEALARLGVTWQPLGTLAPTPQGGVGVPLRRPQSAAPLPRRNLASPPRGGRTDSPPPGAAFGAAAAATAAAGGMPGTRMITATPQKGFMINAQGRLAAGRAGDGIRASLPVPAPGLWSAGRFVMLEEGQGLPQLPPGPVTFLHASVQNQGTGLSPPMVRWELSRPATAGPGGRQAAAWPQRGPGGAVLHVPHRDRSPNARDQGGAAPRLNPELLSRAELLSQYRCVCDEPANFTPVQWAAWVSYSWCTAWGYYR